MNNRFFGCSCFCLFFYLFCCWWGYAQGSQRHYKWILQRIPRRKKSNLINITSVHNHEGQTEEWWKNIISPGLDRDQSTFWFHRWCLTRLICGNKWCKVTQIQLKKHQVIDPVLRLRLEHRTLSNNTILWEKTKQKPPPFQLQRNRSASNKVLLKDNLLQKKKNKRFTREENGNRWYSSQRQ